VTGTNISGDERFENQRNDGFAWYINVLGKHELARWLGDDDLIGLSVHRDLRAGIIGRTV
jgi:hypothetical protein